MIKKIFLLTMFCLVAFLPSTQASTYVNDAHNFKIQLPDDWIKSETPLVKKATFEIKKVIKDENIFLVLGCIVTKDEELYKKSFTLNRATKTELFEYSNRRLESFGKDPYVQIRKASYTNVEKNKAFNLQAKKIFTSGILDMEFISMVFNSNEYLFYVLSFGKNDFTSNDFLNIVKTFELTK